MGVPGILIPFLLLTAILSAVSFRQLVRRRGIEKACTSLQSGHDATMRLLRLAASDQRNVALTLFSHAQTIQPPDAELAGLAQRLLDMSEDLTEQTETPDAVRYLQEEDVQLLPAIEFGVAQVAAHLGPGRRAWRLSPELEPVRLWVDRRAINQVLGNVLSGAVAATRSGDWIEFSIEPGPETWSLVVQDEGVGLPMPATDTHKKESRGIGLRLTLARSLMQAHGGSLTVESAERIGTRVRLSFPVARLLS